MQAKTHFQGIGYLKGGVIGEGKGLYRFDVHYLTLIRSNGRDLRIWASPDCGEGLDIWIGADKSYLPKQTSEPSLA